MKQKLTTLITSASLLFVSLFGGLMLAPSVAAAASGDCSSAAGSNDSATQVLQGVGQVTKDCSGQGVDKITSTVVSVLSYVVGIAAIIMIIVSAFRYISSGGDSNKIASAKSTLIYALIGLAVAGLAQLLVHTVLGAAVNASGG